MVNVFSFCLFGPPSSVNGSVEVEKEEDREFPLGGYYNGLIENIELIRKYYPTWLVYVYLGEDVPESFAMKLIHTYSNIRIRRTGIFGHENTVHRFFAIDEPGVELMFCRDTDSRVHWKDRWAIQSFLNQSYGKVHIIRDHKEHTSKIAAGMWGIRKGVLNESIRELYKKWTPVWAGHGSRYNLTGFGVDQNFLTEVIYPKIRDHVFLTYSHGIRLKGETGIEFPFEWSNDMYVGRIEATPITNNFWTREKETPPPQKTSSYSVFNLLKR